MGCRLIIVYFLLLVTEHDATSTEQFQKHFPLISRCTACFFVHANTSSHACCDQSLSSLHEYPSAPIRGSADSFQGWQRVQSPANKLLFIELTRCLPKCPCWSPEGRRRVGLLWMEAVRMTPSVRC